MDNIYEYSPKQQAYALYGTLLGDASLLKGGWLRIKHTNKQKSYVQALEKLFRSWGLKVSTTYDYHSKTRFGDVIYSEVRLKITPPLWRQIKRLYQDNRKVVRTYVMRRVNALGLLLWWLDDGCLHVRKHHYNKQKPEMFTFKRKAHLATHSFSNHEKDIISRHLKSRFGIKTMLKEIRQKYTGKVQSYHYMSAAEFKKLVDAVYPVLHFVPEDMLYKFNMAYQPDRLYGNIEGAAKYNFESRQEVMEKQSLYCVGSSDPKCGASLVQG